MTEAAVGEGEGRTLRSRTRWIAKFCSLHGKRRRQQTRNGPVLNRGGSLHDWLGDPHIWVTKQLPGLPAYSLSASRMSIDSSSSSEHCQRVNKCILRRKKLVFLSLLLLWTPPFFIAHPFTILTPFRCINLSSLFFLPFTLPFIPHFF